MRNGRKIVRGIGLYREDWDRIESLLRPRESKIDLIEAALIREFEIRESESRGKAAA